jgi:hypothetical protein
MFHRLLQVIEKAGTEISLRRTVWVLYLHKCKAWVAFQLDPHRPVRGKEGARLLGGMVRSDQPLPGKLGWMTSWLGGA